VLSSPSALIRARTARFKALQKGPLAVEHMKPRGPAPATIAIELAVKISTMAHHWSATVARKAGMSYLAVVAKFFACSIAKAAADEATLIANKALHIVDTLARSLEGRKFVHAATGEVGTAQRIVLSSNNMEQLAPPSDNMEQLAPPSVLVNSERAKAEDGDKSDKHSDLLIPDEAYFYKQKGHSTLSTFMQPEDQHHQHQQHHQHHHHEMEVATAHESATIIRVVLDGSGEERLFEVADLQIVGDESSSPVTMQRPKMKFEVKQAKTIRASFCLKCMTLHHNQTVCPRIPQSLVREAMKEKRKIQALKQLKNAAVMTKMVKLWKVGGGGYQGKEAIGRGVAAEMEAEMGTEIGAEMGTEIGAGINLGHPKAATNLQGVSSGRYAEAATEAAEAVAREAGEKEAERRMITMHTGPLPSPSRKASSSLLSQPPPPPKSTAHSAPGVERDAFAPVVPVVVIGSGTSSQPRRGLGRRESGLEQQETSEKQLAKKQNEQQDVRVAAATVLQSKVGQQAALQELGGMKLQQTAPSPRYVGSRVQVNVGLSPEQNGGDSTSAGGAERTRANAGGADRTVANKKPKAAAQREAAQRSGAANSARSSADTNPKRSRRRLSLCDGARRFEGDPRTKDPAVVKQVTRWWRAALDHVSTGDEDDEETRLNYHEYSNVYQRIVFSFNNDGDPRTDIDVLQAKVAMESDWGEDSGGDGSVDKKDFMDMVFELASTWAQDLNGDGEMQAEEVRTMLLATGWLCSLLQSVRTIVCTHHRLPGSPIVERSTFVGSILATSICLIYSLRWC
jgi:hypothetical protein